MHRHFAEVDAAGVFLPDRSRLVAGLLVGVAWS
jgi:hypothetical protein